MWLGSVLGTGDTAGKETDGVLPLWGSRSSGENGQVFKKIDKTTTDWDGCHEGNRGEIRSNQKGKPH